MTLSPPAARRALVTGAGSGLGAALVTILRAEGWEVAGIDLHDAQGDHRYQADVSDPAEIADAVQRAATDLGGIEGVANCAGIFRNSLSPVHALDLEAWHSTLAVNLTGSFHVARETLPHLMKTRGAMVLVASTAAEHPQPGGVAYAASKAGARSLARSVALEYAAQGVRACSVSSGYMRTAMTEKVLARDDMRSAIEASIPAGRAADPAEVATIIAFMLSNRTTFLTGQDVTIDGGGALMAYVGNTDVARMWSRRDRRGE
jgi:NAD(P)-dependent dehydrogenase (short-subunit alcohol dehydrogenase family)